jgi:hypothetical protein
MALQGITGAFCCVIWSMLTDIKKKADKNADELAVYKILVAERHITKTELKDSVDSINQAFERHASRIDVRLDRLEQRILEMKDHQ